MVPPFKMAILYRDRITKIYCMKTNKHILPQCVRSKVILGAIGIVSLGMFNLNCADSKDESSFKPGELWLDHNGVHINAHGGGILVDNGKYYWFGEHKTSGSKGNLANVGVHCYSSDDLYHWKDEGIALSVEPEGSGSPIEKECVIERPKVIYNQKTGKYVMWFHLELKGKGYSAAQCGVAVSDRVTGPYTFLHAGRNHAGKQAMNHPAGTENDWRSKHYFRDFEGGQMSRDMTLFVDDDGTAYHIYASEENSTLQIAQLTDDYTRHTDRYVRLFAGRYMEAPAMFKYQGKYYLMMSGCTGWAPNAARSAVADSVLGEWKELGNPCVDADSTTTYFSQSTYILPIDAEKGKFLYMGDRWNPKDAIDGRYIWLPIEFEGDRFILKWKDEWKLND